MTIFTTREPEREVDDPAAAGRDEYDVDPLEWVPAEMASLTDQVGGRPSEWPPSDEWVRRLREILTEAEAAREEAHGDDPPDTGATLGLEVRGA